MSILPPLHTSRRPDNSSRTPSTTTKETDAIYDPKAAAAAIVTAHRKARGEVHDDGIDPHSDAGRTAAAILRAHEKASGHSE
jgi:hypothetical protein